MARVAYVPHLFFFFSVPSSCHASTSKLTDLPQPLVRIVDIANALPSSLVEKTSKPLPKGFPEITAQPQTYKVRYDTAKEQRILGVKYTTKEETTRDTVEDFVRRGW